MTAVVLRLGLAQTLAWASSFYLPSLLAAPIARELGLAPSTLFAALSAALVLSAMVSPWAGRWIDRHGGRGLLMGSSVLFAAGLVVLSQAQGLWSLALAWGLLGGAMGVGLYDPAFAALVRLYAANARQAITGITLLAGFASTVGWPMTAWMEHEWGWRGACLGWAALHVAVGLPLNAWLPRWTRTAELPLAASSAVSSSGAAQGAMPVAQAAPASRSSMVALAVIFALMGFVSGSVAIHLPGLMQAAGLSLAAAVALAALAGPAQVAARLFEFGVLRRVSPLWSARAASLGHPLAAALMLAFGAPLALAFVLLHGVGNGLLTIVRGTLPLLLFGAQGYGARQGWIALPGRLVGAVSPWLFGMALQRWGLAALWLTGVAGFIAFVLMWRLRPPATQDVRPPATLP